MIQNLIFGIILLKTFLAYSFFILIHTCSSGHHKFFFDFRFSRRKTFSYFAIQVCSKHLTHFTNLNSLEIENGMLACSWNTVKNLSHFTNFSGNMFLFGVRKNICTALFPGSQELHSWSTLKASACIFLYGI